MDFVKKIAYGCYIGLPKEKKIIDYKLLFWYDWVWYNGERKTGMLRRISITIKDPINKAKASYSVAMHTLVQ